MYIIKYDPHTYENSSCLKYKHMQLYGCIYLNINVYTNNFTKILNIYDNLYVYNSILYIWNTY